MIKWACARATQGKAQTAKATINEDATEDTNEKEQDFQTKTDLKHLHVRQQEV